jgi:hypothetical protein
MMATEKGIMGLYGLTISGVCVAGRSFIAGANLKTGLGYSVKWAIIHVVRYGLDVA